MNIIEYQKRVFKALKLLILPSLILCMVTTVNAQSTKKRYLFQEDSPLAEKQRKAETKAITRPLDSLDSDFDFKAPEVEYLQEQKLMKGSGGVALSKDGFQAQAENIEINTETKAAKLADGIVLTWPEGQLSAEEAEFNFEKETGSFKKLNLELEDSNYQVNADEGYKDSDIDYRFFNSEFTTCRCPDGAVPWSIDCDRAKLRQDGYAHTYGTTFNVHGVPVFYSPYLLVPIKTTRQSGLLAPSYGYGSVDGIAFSQPLYLVLDDYSDTTITPFIETKTRAGVKFDYRHVFSRTSQVESRWYYSDETRRDGDLRNTVVTNLSDPTFEENRHGGFIKQNWQSAPESLIPTRINTDIHYISDDLFLREIEDDSVGERYSRYTTSRILMQNMLGASVFSEVAGEYNQAIETDDDLVFQRLPEASLFTRETFRPFGYNPFGAKMVAGMQLGATNFTRKEGFDGMRYNMNPSLRVPHHFQNYLSADFTADMYNVFYDQNEEMYPNSVRVVEDDELKAYRFSYGLSSAVEKVYDLNDDSWLTYITSLGAQSQTHRLSRVKHVVEPQLRYIYTPFTNQEGLPLYDSTDRVKQRSLVSYGFRTSLLGKFDTLGGSSGITELTPELEDLPALDSGLGFSEDNSLMGSGPQRFWRAQRAKINEIAYLSVLQSYDYLEDKKDLNPEQSPFSDIGFESGFYPTSYFGLLLDGNFDHSDRDLSSWSTGFRFRDDRGDQFTGRYWYIDEQVSQLDATLEISLTDRLKLGFFGRFDEETSEFIESESALRVISACNCWYVDLGYRDTTNPNKSQGMVRFTFLGLGDLLQKFSLDQNENQS